MKMRSEIRRQKLIRISVELTTLAALLLGIFTPKLGSSASMMYPRLQLSLIMVIISAVVILVFGGSLKFPSRKSMVLGLVFPGYLLIRGLFDSPISLSLIGNHERNLGVLTYLACFLFYFVGLVLMLNCPSAIIRILAIILGIEILRLFLDLVNQNSSVKNGIFNNSNAESFFLTILLVSISVFLIEKLSGRFKILLVAPSIALSSLLVLIWLESTQGILGYTITALLYICYRLISNPSNFSVLVRFGLLGGFTAFLSFVFLRSIPKYELVDTNSFYERLEIYKTSILGIRENPFFGGGIDRFNEVYFSLNVSENLKLVDNAHSIPLQLLATTGLCGFIAWLILFQRAIKTPIHKKSPVPTALYFGVLAYLITGLFGIQVPAIEFLVYLMLGGISASVPGGQYKEFSGKARTVPTGILVLVLVFSSLQISTYLSQVNKLDNIAYSKAKFEKGKQDFFMGIQEINDIGLLSNAGQFSIRTGDREFSLLVLKQMINLNSFDQRTIAFALQLAGEWNSAELQKIGNDLNLKARNKS
jgi:hypothetical protein